MRRLPAWLLALAFTATAPCLAQSRLEPPDLEDYLRWGPFRVRPGVQIVNLGYDDNIFASNVTKVGDYTGTIAPRINGLVLFGHRTFLTFLGQAEYTAYLENSDQNYFNLRSSGRFMVPFSRFGLFAAVKFDQVEERPVDREDIRPRRKEQGRTLGAIFELGWRTEIELSQTVTDWRYSDPDFALKGQSIAEILDRDEVRRALAASYRVLGRTRLTLDLETADIDFDEPFISGQIVSDKDTKERSGLVGLRFGEGGILGGTVRVGWTEIDILDPGLKDFSGAVGDAELVYRMTSRTRLEFEGERITDFAVYRDQTYLVNTNGRLRAIRSLNRIVALEADIFSGELEFPGSTVAVPRKDDLFGYGGGVRLRLAENSMGRRVEYRVRLTRFERKSNLPGLDRSQTRVAIDAVLGF